MAKKPDSLIVVDAHHPALPTGSYHVAIDQAVTSTAGNGVNEQFGSAARFHVLGPRVALEPGWIAGRFPAPHSTGDHANVLPHVALTRSTLPWERDAIRRVAGQQAAQAQRPWLAMLLLADDEMGGGPLPAAELHQVAAGDLDAATVGPGALPAFPGLDNETGSNANDQVRVLDVARGVVEPILPEAPWLSSLTHVKEHLITQLPNPLGYVDSLNRQELDDGLRGELRQNNCPIGPQARVEVSSVDAEWTITDRETGRTYYLELDKRDPDNPTLDVADEARAVVVSCRLTGDGHRYSAFLVSMEGRYTGSPAAFDFGAATDNADLVRFVVLDTWTFDVDPNAGQLEHLLVGLVEGTSETGDTFAKDLTLTVPIVGKSGSGVTPLQAGYAFLPHDLRHGGHTRSWYRGPLVPRSRAGGAGGLPNLPVTASDQLLVLDNLHQLFDCSFAAAWELGRHLILSNRDIALDLTAWKRARRRRDHHGSVTPSHVPRRSAVAADDALDLVPTSVGDFVERISLLDGIPFNYLVPDPAMLPLESLKTFEIDHWWMYYLLDGIASLGRVHERDVQQEVDIWLRLQARAFGHVIPSPGTNPHPEPISGVLIRSEVVSGFPDLHIELLHPNSDVMLKPLRRAKLSDNVLLILVEGRLGRVRMHPNAEALHHGVPEELAVAANMRSADVIDPFALFRPQPSGQPLSPAAFGWELTKTGPPLLDIQID